MLRPIPVRLALVLFAKVLDIDQPSIDYVASVCVTIQSSATSDRLLFE